MKNKTYCLKITLLCSALAFLTACETGVKNKANSTTSAPSGIINKGSAGYVDNQQSFIKAKTRRIFSNSATPGYYIQVGYYGKEKPNKAFKHRLDKSKFNYIILEKDGEYYALVGAYISYNQAKKKLSNVKSSLNYKAFVVQVLRP